MDRYWVNKRVLVTGADGFIGSHLAEMLVRQGAMVRALTFYNSFNSWGWLDHSDFTSQMEVLAGDIRDPFFCDKALENVDVVFHLAALIAIPYSYSAPASYVETNVNGTLNILQAAKRNHCQQFIHTSSSEVYGSALNVPIDESHPIQPQSPYSASKVGADAIAYSFYTSFQLPVIIARPFNTYGPRQSARAVIPSIITQLSCGSQAIKIGSSTPTRDFTFVADTCMALIKLAQSSGAEGQVVNIGSNYEISISDLFDRVCAIMGREATLVCEQERIRPEKSEVNRLWCDNTKLKRFTGFTPATDLKSGLEACIEWFGDSENLKLYKTGIYNV